MLRILANASATIAERRGAAIDHRWRSGDRDRGVYAVIEGKTAALFAAAAEVGGVLAERPTETRRAAHLWPSLGIAFQLVDDQLGLCSQRGSMGKSVGDDFRERKVTMPVIIAYQKGSTDERPFGSAPSARASIGGDLREAQRCGSLMIRWPRQAGSPSARRGGRGGSASFPRSRIARALQDVAAFCVARAI